MSKVFNLSIVSPEKTVYEGEAISLIAPCESGYLGVLADHAPLVSNLSGGNIFLRETSGKEVFFKLSGKGFLEVLKNNVTILVDHE